MTTKEGQPLFSGACYFSSSNDWLDWLPYSLLISGTLRTLIQPDHSVDTRWLSIGHVWKWRIYRVRKRQFIRNDLRLCKLRISTWESQLARLLASDCCQYQRRQCRAAGRISVDCSLRFVNHTACQPWFIATGDQPVLSLESHYEALKSANWITQIKF